MSFRLKVRPQFHEEAWVSVNTARKQYQQPLCWLSLLGGIVFRVISHFQCQFEDFINHRKYTVIKGRNLRCHCFQKTNSTHCKRIHVEWGIFLACVSKKITCCCATEKLINYNFLVSQPVLRNIPRPLKQLKYFQRRYLTVHLKG